MGDEDAGMESGEAFLTIEAAVDDGAPAADSADEAPDPAGRNRPRRVQMPALSPLRLALIVGLAFIVALGGLCGWLGYRAHQARQAEQFRALLIQVGKQGAVNLTTIDYEHAEADVQRILDSATGEFYDDFNNRAGPFVDVVKKVQSKSAGTVTEAGLESVNGQEGQVLVAVTVKTTTKSSPDEQPRYWRMRMTVGKQGEDFKVSKVDFVP